MPVFVGLIMSLASVTAALLITLTRSFPELVYNCAENGLDEIACGHAAVKVGLYSTGAFAAVLVISVCMWRYARRWNSKTFTPISPVATKFVVAAAMAVATAHYLGELYAPASTSRIDELVRFFSLIQLENLLWPLLLQLLVSESEGRIRIAIVTALAAIMALTPYRGVYTAILIFGFAVPIVSEIASDIRLRGLVGAITRSAKPAALAALILVCTLWSGYVDSAARDLRDLLGEARVQAATQTPPAAQPGRAELPSRDVQPTRPAESPSQPAEPASRPAEPQARPAEPQARDVQPAVKPAAANQAPVQGRQDLLGNLFQRVAHPLVQAAITEHLAAHMAVPSIMDEFLYKFRIGSRLPLNQFLYYREYQSGQGVGGAQPLYYGEAAAYVPPRFILLWLVAAPLPIVIVWLALRAKIIDAGTLCGVQMWRSSLAGIVTILPAFVIQVLTLIGMVALSRLLARSRMLEQRLSGASILVALVAVAALVGVQCWTLVDGRNTTLVMGLVPPQGCVFVDWLGMPQTVDAVLADRGVNIRSALWYNERSTDERNPDFSQRSRPILIQIPQGHAAKRFAGEILGRLAGNIDCEDKSKAVPPRMVTEHFFQQKGSLPFELLVVGFGLLTLVSLVREMRNHPPANQMATFSPADTSVSA